MTGTERRHASRQTPYNDAYGTCERTRAELRIYGDDLEPAVITARLGIQPTTSQSKGAVVVNSRGVARVIPVGGWFLSSEGQVHSLDLRRHLDWLLGALAPRATALNAVQETEGIVTAVVCIWWSRSGAGGPTLWPEQMRGLAELNLECSFEIGFYGDDETSA